MLRSPHKSVPVQSVLCLYNKGRGRGPAYYHTENCFGYWKKPHTTTDSIQSEWVESRRNQSNLWRLVTSYHEHGHKIAATNPLGIKEKSDLIELSPSVYGLDVNSSELYNTRGILHCYDGERGARLSEILAYLDGVYCGPTAIEVSHMTDSYMREWVLESYETHVRSELSLESRQKLAQHLMRSQVFDQFMAKKFGTVKRYGAEGAESMMGFIDEVFNKATTNGSTSVSDVLIGMPHRGRLNVLVGLLHYSPAALFHKIKGNSEFSDTMISTGDVLSHLISSVDLTRGGRSLHVTMLPNPSHLEAVNPVVMGKTRGRMLTRLTGPYNGIDKSHVLCLQIHGDASFAGQGVVMECLALSDAPHFEIGGSVHLIVNNYLGFTTPEDYGRSSMYCSDIAKMTGCPVIHVNGNHPEEVVKACRVAMDYRLKFEKDVLVVMNCYRQWGHNELDDPTMTQPGMYKVINSLSSVPDGYWGKNVESLGDSTMLTGPYYEQLNECFKDSDNLKSQETNFGGEWRGIEQPQGKITQWDTGLDSDLLLYIGAKSVDVPKEMAVHQRLQVAHIEDRLQRLCDNRIDWSTAEAMALGSLLYQGFNVRLSGQDVGRGTFSHRHVMLVDQDSDTAHIPLNSLTESQTNFIEVANSPLSEEAVLGYEYGFSIENPRHLVLWEAQFGDFFNGAQIIIDTFISSGEDKWLYQSGLVMLLPHGYDGAGPDHSSCRVERFLQMTNSNEDGGDSDRVNMHIAHPTTPSQYFHLLRRQMLRNFRKPLIVQSPKILLRLPAAVSSLEEMLPGTVFQPVLGDASVTNHNNVKRVILCSGKHYYALDAYRKANNIQNVAIIRIELLCPFPCGALAQEFNKYKHVKEFVWSQEEPANMGAWSFIEPRLRRQLGINLSKVTRPPYGPPATGIGKVHQVEAKMLLSETFEKLG